MNSNEEQNRKEELLTSSLTDLDILEDEEQDNEMQQLLASMLLSMNGVKQENDNQEGGCSNQEGGCSNQEGSNNNMQQLLASMLSSMNGIKEEGCSNKEEGCSNQGEGCSNQEEGCNNMQQLLASMISSMQGSKEGGSINDLFSNLLGNMKNTEETLDDDYVLEDGGGEEGDGCEEEGEDVLSEEDFKEMITSFNEANMVNNFKVMFEMLSQKIPQPLTTDATTSVKIEDVD